MHTEVAADALGERWRVTWSDSVVGTAGFSHDARCLDPWQNYLLLNKEHSCYTTRDTGERKKGRSVHRCIADECFQLACCKKDRWGRDVSRLTHTTVPWWLGPKRASRILRIFQSLQTRWFLLEYCQKAFNKEDKESRTKAHKIQHLVIPCNIV